MTASLIAPLIPPRARPSGREHGRTGTTRPLPVAAAPERSALACSCAGAVIVELVVTLDTGSAVFFSV